MIAKAISIIITTMYKVSFITHTPFRGRIRDKSSQSTSGRYGMGAKCDEQAFALITTPRLSAPSTPRKMSIIPACCPAGAFLFCRKISILQLLTLYHLPRTLCTIETQNLELSSSSVRKIFFHELSTFSTLSKDTFQILSSAGRQISRLYPLIIYLPTST